jgi:hypothetical protein
MERHTLRSTIMQHRSVTLPLFGLLTKHVHQALVVDTVLSVPGVMYAHLSPETEVLDLQYDPARCGPVQLLEAIESFGNRGEHLPGADRW